MKYSKEDGVLPIFFLIIQSTPRPCKNRSTYLPFLFSWCIKQDFKHKSQWLSSKSKQIKFNLIRKGSIFLDKYPSMFGFSICRIFIPYSRIFKRVLISFHMTNLQITQDNDRNTSKGNTTSKIQIFSYKIQSFIKEMFSENMRRC